jgi:hypothetical protein
MGEKKSKEIEIRKKEITWKLKDMWKKEKGNFKSYF